MPWRMFGRPPERPSQERHEMTLLSNDALDVRPPPARSISDKDSGILGSHRSPLVSWTRAESQLGIINTC